jgi:hypothetical protein
MNGRDKMLAALMGRVGEENTAPLQSMMQRGDMGGAFREDMFLRQISNTPWFGEFTQQYGETPDLNYPGYDYRAAMAAGSMPERDPYDPSLTQAMDQAAFGTRAPGTYHWTSQYKAGDHPTMWKEQFMQLDPQGRNPDELGIVNAQAASRYLLRRR